MQKYGKQKEYVVLTFACLAAQEFGGGEGGELGVFKVFFISSNDDISLAL